MSYGYALTVYDKSIYYNDSPKKEKAHYMPSEFMKIKFVDYEKFSKVYSKTYYLMCVVACRGRLINYLTWYMNWILKEGLLIFIKYHYSILRGE